jgi:hypothetical protein
MPMKLSAVLSLVLFAAIPCASAQRVDWDMKGAQELSQPLSSLSTQDQAGILHLLGGNPEDLRAMRVTTASSHIFLVQGINSSSESTFCGNANCEFWILSSNYKVLMENVTQTYKLLSTMHHGLPDIITSMHGSAYDSGLSYWRFQGKHYVRVTCADAEYGDWDGNFYRKPHISPHPCGTGG